MLKFLLIFFIVLYLLGYFGRLIFNYWIRKVTNQTNQNSYNNNKKEGEVTITTDTGNSKQSNIKGGEYVDYEEIND